MPVSPITEYRETELTVELAKPIAELACLSFSSSGSTLEKRIQEMLAARERRSGGYQQPPICYLGWR